MIDDCLAIAGRYLAGLPGLRAEWSLKVTENDVSEREQPIFWVGDRLGFDRLGELLQYLECPDVLSALQQRLSGVSVYQGIRLSATGSYSLYLSCMENGLPRKTGHTWQAGRMTCEDEYRSFSFPADTAAVSELRAIHPDLQRGWIQLISLPAVRRSSGYWTQLEHGIPKEVYITFPWHPVLQTAIRELKPTIPFFSAGRLGNYADLHFRHLGFSTTEPVVTCYFCAPLRGNWPVNFRALRQQVSTEGMMLHQALKGSFNRQQLFTR